MALYNFFLGMFNVVIVGIFCCCANGCTNAFTCLYMILGIEAVTVRGNAAHFIVISVEVWEVNQLLLLLTNSTF